MRERLIGVAVIAILLVLLEMAARGGAVNATLVPPPSAIAERTYAIIANGSVLQPLAQTLHLLFVAYFLACGIAIALGLLMGRFHSVYNLFEPVVESLRPLPKAALLPPLMMLLGLGDAMKLAIVGLAVFFPVLINTVQGVRGVDAAHPFRHAGWAWARPDTRDDGGDDGRNRRCRLSHHRHAALVPGAEHVCVDRDPGGARVRAECGIPEARASGYALGGSEVFLTGGRFLS
jgi:hypothetical protein